MGIPILRAPFDFVTRLFGLVGFPDRWLFLLFFTGVSLLLLYAFEKIIASIHATAAPTTKFCLAASSATFLLLFPGFIFMLSRIFLVYEEIISYGYLWVLMLFSLLVITIETPRTSVYLGICALSAFTMYIRPPLFVYGAMTAFVVSIHRIFRFGARRQILAGLSVFLAVLIPLLAANQLRFGDPLEFGHTDSVSWPFINYITRFHAPWETAAFFPAAAELIGGLFFTPVPLPERGLPASPWMLAIPRFRELSFRSYDGIVLLCFIVAVGAGVAFWILGQKKTRATRVHSVVHESPLLVCGRASPLVLLLHRLFVHAGPVFY